MSFYNLTLNCFSNPFLDNLRAENPFPIFFREGRTPTESGDGMGKFIIPQTFSQIVPGK